MSTSRTRSIALGVIALIGLAQSSLAQIGPIPVPNPTAPWLQRPVGVIPGQTTGTFTLEWQQRLLSLTFPQPASANHFIICVYIAATQTCDNTPYRYTRAAVDIPRVPVSAQTNGPFNPITAYAYSFQLPAAPPVLPKAANKPLKWNVGACATMAETSCTFASPRNLAFSTQNFIAENVSHGGTGGMYLSVHGHVRNGGTANTVRFTAVVSAYRALLNSLGDSCDTNVNNFYQPGPGNQEGNYVALTDRGERIFISDLPGPPGAHVLGGRTVIAIYASSETGTPASAPININLAPGDTFPVIDSTWTVTGNPVAYGTVLDVDPNNLVAELDETDNSHAECIVVF